MTDIFDVIRTSISVPRPRLVTAPEVLSALADPGDHDPDKVSVAEAVLTEISLSRLSELVRTGAISWRQISVAVQAYGLARTEAGQLAAEMAQSDP
nr:hypothetical protein [uncultured Rhodopila sp.]